MLTDFESYLRKSVVKVLSANGTPIGSAFWILQHFCVTCLHNLQGTRGNVRPEVSVDCDGRVLTAAYREDLSCPESDIAVLELNEFVGTALPVSEALVDVEVRAFGYRRGFDEGYTVTGRLRPGQVIPNGGLVYNLETNQPDKSSLAGMSGCPVFDPRRQAVIGIQHAEEEQGPSIAYVHPLNGILKQWQALKTENARAVSGLGFGRIGQYVEQDFKVSLSRLPATGRKLFGREKQLQLLDEIWENRCANVISVVAFGGVGKSTLIKHWLGRMALEKYRGADRVYAWSFYRQGTGDDVVSADEFVDDALRWFGDPNPATGTPWDKGRRLAELVRAFRTLLVLDGLEPLQYPPGPEEGRLKDDQLRALLTELSAHNPGLCVISSRLPILDLQDFEPATVRRIDLEHLSPEAGAKVLETQGVKGDENTLQEISKVFGGHALAITLLGSLLSEAFGGDAQCWREAGPLEGDERQGAHARRVMIRYEQWFAGGPELDVLAVLGLFDRPADRSAFSELRKSPAIAGLSSNLTTLDERQFQKTLAKLRRTGLLGEQFPDEPDTLDAHPLVREYFGERLRQVNPDGWRAGHSRLYDYLTHAAAPMPKTLEETAVLFTAMSHGCFADRHRDVLKNVYRDRVLQGYSYFSTDKLGAYGAGLAALSGFFESPWDKPVAVLDQAEQAFVQHEVAVHLVGVGRLGEALKPFTLAVEIRESLEDFSVASQSSRYLAELYSTLGYLSQAVECARHSVVLADLAGDSMERMANRNMLGEILHQAGHMIEAESSFREAEQIPDANGKPFPNVFLAWGRGYGELLLDLGRQTEALQRARRDLEKTSETEGSLLATAQIYLALGRALSADPSCLGVGDFDEAIRHLNRAVDLFRKAGHQLHLPTGLLARADLRRLAGNSQGSQADLNETAAIAGRSGMALYLADCNLGRTRLHLAAGKIDEARVSLGNARDIIARTGYHRRDSEVLHLQARLRPGATDS